VFAHRALDVQLSNAGYVVVRLLDPDQVVAVRAAVEAAGPAPGDPRTGLFNDTWSTDHRYKVTTAAALRTALAGVVPATFTGHRNLAWTTITKWPGTEGAVVAHRDPSFVDEPGHASYGIWCALDDLGPAQGTLYVVPGSHRGAPPIRVHQSTDNLDPGLDPATDPRAETISLAAGDALVYHHGLLHGSGPNQTAHQRSVVAGLLVPDGVPARYSVELEPGRGATVEVDPDFFVDLRLDHLDLDAVLARCSRIDTLRRRPDGRWMTDPA